MGQAYSIARRVEKTLAVDLGEVAMTGLDRMESKKDQSMSSIRSKAMCDGKCGGAPKPTKKPCESSLKQMTTKG